MHTSRAGPPSRCQSMFSGQCVSHLLHGVWPVPLPKKALGALQQKDNVRRIWGHGFSWMSATTANRLLTVVQLFGIVGCGQVIALLSLRSS